MTTYTCDGYRSIKHDGVDVASAIDAARIFATREAKRKFGRTAYCRTLRLDSWCGSFARYEAFIGRDVPGDRNTTSGRNVWIEVTTRD